MDYTPTVGLDPSQNGVKIVNPPTEPIPVVGELLAVIPPSAFSAKARGTNLLSAPDPAGTRYRF
jgi:hypothetical protein